MAKVKCANCKTEWELGTATTNRCPQCQWITEIYYDENQANHVASIYNERDPPLPQLSGVQPLIGINGYSVSFPDEGRLAEVAERLLDESGA